MRAFKNRSWMETVYISDQVTLLNVKMGSHFLQSNKDGSTVYEKRDSPADNPRGFEVNLSSVPTSWRLQAFRRLEPHMDKHLQVGQAIRLYHVEAECTLSASAKWDAKTNLPPKLPYMYRTHGDPSHMDNLQSKQLFFIEKLSRWEGGPVEVRLGRVEAAPPAARRSGPSARPPRCDVPCPPCPTTASV